MTIIEKYPENIPWDADSKLDQSKEIQWMLTKAENVFTFTRSKINDKYVYIQKNKGQKFMQFVINMEASDAIQCANIIRLLKAGYFNLRKVKFVAYICAHVYILSRSLFCRVSEY